MRRELVRRGHPEWLVAGTPRARLNWLDQHTPELPELVDDVEAPEPEQLCPNLVFRPEGPRLDVPITAETTDERASTLHFLRTLRLEQGERGGLVAPKLDVLGADDRTPWDEFTGGDAA